MATPKLLHLRSAVQGKLPSPSAIEVGQVGVNYNAADPFLCIKDTAGNVVRLEEVFVGAAAPSAAKTGLLFVDTSKTPPAVKVYDGAAWQPVTQTIAAATTTVAGLMSAADKTKLDGVAAGAQANVKPDWNAAVGDAAEILNKPSAYTLPAATVAALGGIKVGTNVAVATDGTLSVATGTNSASGVLRLATDAEARTGTSQAVAINPKQLKDYGVPAGTNAGDLLTWDTTAPAKAVWKTPVPYTLPAATAAALGGVKVGTALTATSDGTLSADQATTARVGVVKVGTGLSIASDGTLNVNLSGALIYKGQADPTGTAPTAANGDVYLASKGGTYSPSWGGLSGTATKGEMLVYVNGSWDAVGQAAVTVKPDWNAAAGTAAEILNLPRGTTAQEYMRWSSASGSWVATNTLEGGTY